MSTDSVSYLFQSMIKALKHHSVITCWNKILLWSGKKVSILRPGIGTGLFTLMAPLCLRKLSSVKRRRFRAVAQISKSSAKQLQIMRLDRLRL